MKKNLLLIFSLLLMTLALPTFAQDRNNEEEVVHIDQMQRRAARPGQLIVKFHDRSDIRVDAQDNRRFSCCYCWHCRCFRSFVDFSFNCCGFAF